MKRFKFTDISEKDALQLLKNVLEEAQTTTNLLIIDAVARCVTFVVSLMIFMSIMPSRILSIYLRTVGSYCLTSTEAVTLPV